MRYLFAAMTLWAAIALSADVLALKTPSIPFQPDQRTPQRAVVFSDDFETGAPDWITQDGAEPQNWTEAWRLSDIGAYQGDSWWMGDPELGGYHDERYLALDTPEIPITASGSTLTFRMSYAIEAAGGVDNYTAWDGFNVRVSTDQGVHWQVISGSPAYTATSLYSFGEIFGEGVGTPGWCGASSGWISASFNLSAYIGQSIAIRFAFASDAATSTVDDATLFGARLDDIQIGSFLSDGEHPADDDRMIPGYGGQIGGDHWTLSSQQFLSPGFSMFCPVLPNLSDELITPIIYLPNRDSLQLDYYIRFDAPDTVSNDVPDDYFRVYVLGEEDPAWTGLHFDTNRPPIDWFHVDAQYCANVLGTPLGCDLSAWAGQHVRIKFVMHTDGDETTGAGMYIDDVRVTAAPELDPPQNLSAMIDDAAVYLSWSMVSGATSYKVYRGMPGGTPALIASPEYNDYTDAAAGSGFLYEYRVQTVVSTYSSTLSEPRFIFVPADESMQSFQDDGSPDSDFTPPLGSEYFAPLSAPNASHPWFLTHVRIFLNNPGTQALNVVVRANTTRDDAPGAILADFYYPLGRLQTGWNDIPVPHSVPQFSALETVWIGVRGTQGAPEIGVDPATEPESVLLTTNNAEWQNQRVFYRAWFGETLEAGDPVTPTPTGIRIVNAPNPFNPETRIALSLDRPARVDARIYNLRGECVATLCNGQLPRGEHSFVWRGANTSGRPCASGVYLCRVTAGTESVVRRMMLLK
jgi:hypothetical protein